MVKKYKLFNTDGKTFFDFRSDPKSRCEGFTLTYCDDGTVVMSGDYGTLCWKRNYHHEGDKEFHRDYGFPGKNETDETHIGYFAEKVCQFGVEQVIEEFDKDVFFANVKESYCDEPKWEEFAERFELIEDRDEWKAYELATEYFIDAWECRGKKYTSQFKFMFEILKSVSGQIWDAVNKEK